MSSYDNPSSFLDGLGFRPTWPCCNTMKDVLADGAIAVIATAQLLDTEPMLVLRITRNTFSANTLTTSFRYVEIKHCPFCGADTALIRQHGLLQCQLHSQ